MVFVLLALFIRRFDGDGLLDMDNRSGRLACGAQPRQKSLPPSLGCDADKTFRTKCSGLLDWISAVWTVHNPASLFNGCLALWRWCVKPPLPPLHRLALDHLKYADSGTKYEGGSARWATPPDNCEAKEPYGRPKNLPVRDTPQHPIWPIGIDRRPGANRCLQRPVV